MGKFSQLETAVKIPITLSTPDYLMDHHFQGRPVFPAVEAMEAMVRAIKKQYPRLDVDRITDVGLDKFLFMNPQADQLDAAVMLKPDQSGGVQATLTTRTKALKASFFRMKNHAGLNIDGSAPASCLPPLDMVSAIEGICFKVPSKKIYKDLVPLGPAFRNVHPYLFISPDGAMACIQTPDHQYHHTDDGAKLLGSGYALDAAMHAACVWAQCYKNIVAFPVALAKRTIINPVSPASTYIGRIIPKAVLDHQLIFDILLFNQNGIACEFVEGVCMRDVSGGRWHPPDWIGRLNSTDPLKNLRINCCEIVVIELDTVADFACQSLTPLEMRRYRKMGDKRQKSYLAARLALKRLHRKCMDDWTKPADQIETIRETSPLPKADLHRSYGNYYCSVSHDHRFAIAVVAPQAVGVDVEVISPKALKSSRIFMTAAERILVQQSPIEDIAAAVRIWSAKEAVAKSMGVNLADAWMQVQVTKIGEKESRLIIDKKEKTVQHAVVEEHLFTLMGE